MGEYCSASDVPLNRPFVCSRSNKRLIVSCYHDKRFRCSLSTFICFPSFLFDCVFFYSFSAKYGRYSSFLRNVSSQFEFLKIQTLEHSDPPLHNEFAINVTNVPFLLVGGFGCLNPAEWQK